MKYFCAYNSYLEDMVALNDAECGRLFRACLQYSRSGVETPLSGNERVLFPAFKSQIDRDHEKYTERCEKNRRNRQESIRKRGATMVDSRDQGEREEDKNGERKGERSGTLDGGLAAPQKKYPQSGSGIGHKL